MRETGIAASTSMSSADAAMIGAIGDVEYIASNATLL
jgi:hypothetical protein